MTADNKKKRAIRTALGLAAAAFVSVPVGTTGSTMAIRTGKRALPGGRMGKRAPGLRAEAPTSGKLEAHSARPPGIREMRTGKRFPGIRTGIRKPEGSDLPANSPLPSFDLRK